MPKGIAEPSIVAVGGLKAAEQYQLVATQPSHPAVGEGAALPKKAHKAQNSVSHTAPREVEIAHRSLQEAVLTAAKGGTNARSKPQQRSANRISQLDHQQVTAVKNYIASSPYLHLQATQDVEKPVFKPHGNQGHRPSGKGKKAQKQRTAEFLGGTALKGKIAVVNSAPQQPDMQPGSQNETKVSGGGTSQPSHDLTQFYLQQQTFAQREQGKLYKF